MRALAEALRFLSTIPIPGKPPRNYATVQAAYPLAGLVIGLLIACAAWMASWILGSGGTAVTAVVAGILLTGGLHLDGLADLADGLGGGRDRKKTLAIMSDSRLGSFGALALIAMFALQTAVIAGLLDSGELPIPAKDFLPLPMAAVISRGILPLIIAIFPSARPGGMGDSNRKISSAPVIIFAILVSILTAFLVMGFAGLFLLTIVTGITTLSAWWISRRLGGLTGDVYGALIESGYLMLLTGVLLIDRFDLSASGLL